ncbi:MAG: S49 family peptidase [Alphaproteobacteria bacterium]|nr:S49 family peptidase [Alphaproteobacteria bacterium]
MWDIPSGTGLAIQIDALPSEAPQGAIRALPLAAQKRFAQQGNIAVIDISGVITPYQNILSVLFGGTDVQSIGEQLESAVNDPAIGGIILRIDSPGGIITGVEELASTIAAARGKKPIVAYAYGNAASAAYWIASAADRIVAGPTTSLGSIGVAMAVAKDQDKGWVRFVSSNAPGKKIDPSTREGQDSIQRRLDAMEAEFVAAIAAHRGISQDEVLQDFGRGDVLPAREAVRVGMADMVGGFRDALALLFDPEIQPSNQGETMSKQENPAPQGGETIRRDQVTAEFLMREFPQIAGVLIREGREQSQDTIKKQGYEEGMAAGAKAERERILSIEAMALAGHEDMVAEAKKDGKTQPGDLAMKMVAAQKQRGFSFLESRREDANANKGIGPATDPQPMSPGVDASAPIEERAAAEWASDPKIRTEFGDKETYLAFRKAEDEGRVRRFAK